MHYNDYDALSAVTSLLLSILPRLWIYVAVCMNLLRYA
jgi:hypothetical protein